MRNASVSHLLAVRKGEDVMSTMTGNLRRTMLLGALGALVLAGAATVVRADVASDKPGAILIFPKVVVDPSGVLGPLAGTDTELQVVNTSNSVVAAKCFIINQTSHCSNTGEACTAANAAEQCPGGACLPPCSPRVAETDFFITLTKRQPISWKASEGLSNSEFPCATTNTTDPGCIGGQSSGNSSIPGVQEVPFVGEIKCVEVDKDTFAPTNGLDPSNNFIGDLKGEATIVASDGTTVDARKYNGIGLQSTGFNNGDLNLQIGGPSAEYNGCPKVITLNSLFDDAVVTTHRGGATHSVRTDLTVVPCSEDFFSQNPTGSTLQFLVFNEFEQRFSTSTGVSCFREVVLSDIDSRPGSTGDAQSIFNIAVEGTLSGQIRIRPVASGTADRRVLAITEEFWTTGSAVRSSAANTFFVPSAGTTDLGDVISLPLE